MINLIQGDIRACLAELAENSFDSCVTDPPYELGFMGSGFTGIELDPHHLDIAERRIPGSDVLGRIVINDSQSLEKMIQGSERSLGDGALRSG